MLEILVTQALPAEAVMAAAGEGHLARRSILELINLGTLLDRVHRGVVGTNRQLITLETLLLLCYPLVGAVVQALAAMELLVILAAAAIQELHQVLQV
jgi:hypothetical protein